MEERQKPKWAKAAVTLISALGFVVGLAGAPDDLQKWYGWLQQGVPWWVFIAASMVLPMLVWLPEIKVAAQRLFRRQTRSTNIYGVAGDEDGYLKTVPLDAVPGSNKGHQLSDSADEVPTLRRRIIELENQIGKLEAHREKQTEDIKRSKENVESLRQENERRGRVFHECRYGYLPREPLETPHDLREVVDEVRRFMPLLRTAHSGAQAVLDSLLQSMRAQDNACGKFLFLFVKDSVYNRCEMSYGLLVESLNTYTDPRLALATYYYQYMQVRVWIGRSENVWGVDTTMREQINRWLEDDKRFRGRLAESLEVAVLLPVGSEIQRLNREHHYPPLVE